MKVVRLNGLKPEIVNLDYKVIKEEKEQYEKKNKVEKAASYSKLLNNLKDDSTAEEIENAVNSIIDSDTEKVKELKKEIKLLEKEILFLSQISRREQDADAFSAIIASL